mmetsp:Transcript_17980/g.60645  ORF Transcript_17980/g.60645 Transcript_17980/m.60645 type:complete len:203 (-) Transcript_17980:690-1298(-)
MRHFEVQPGLGTPVRPGHGMVLQRLRSFGQPVDRHRFGGALQPGQLAARLGGGERPRHSHRVFAGRVDGLLGDDVFWNHGHDRLCQRPRGLRVLRQAGVPLVFRPAAASAAVLALYHPRSLDHARRVVAGHAAERHQLRPLFGPAQPQALPELVSLGGRGLQCRRRHPSRGPLRGRASLPRRRPRLLDCRGAVVRGDHYRRF